MSSIVNLGNLFCKYGIYPKNLYISGTPLKEFQKLYPCNHYSRDVETLIALQDYPSVRRGADLPWWGENVYTSNSDGKRVMLIAQDSKASDAGSVVMYSHLYNAVPIYSDSEYKTFTNRLSSQALFKYSNWKRAFQQIKDWKLDTRNIYLTDAKKVYKERQEGKTDSFDTRKSALLLEEEIQAVKPDFIITLGKDAYDLFCRTTLLLEKKNYSEAVESGRAFTLTHGKLIVSPFITGACQTSPNFKERLKIATQLINQEINSE